MSAPSTPWPLPDAVTEPFWDGCRKGVLLLQRCSACAALQFYPRAVCTSCMSTDLTWEPASGEGTVHSLTVARRAAWDAFRERVPLIVALIDLVEGPRLLSNVTGAEPGEVRIGDRVRVVFTEVDDGVVLPMFAPIARRGDLEG